MHNEDLKRSLEQLRAEIRKLGDDEEPAKSRMRNLVADLERQLADAGDDEQHSQLIEKLRRHIEQFEVEHPRLTGVLNRIMVALSNLGI